MKREIRSIGKIKKKTEWKRFGNDHYRFSTCYAWAMLDIKMRSGSLRVKLRNKDFKLRMVEENEPNVIHKSQIKKTKKGRWKDWVGRDTSDWL